MFAGGPGPCLVKAMTEHEYVVSGENPATSTVSVSSDWEMEWGREGGEGKQKSL